MSIKQKIAIYITVVILATGGIVYAVILPTIRDIESIKESVLAERIDLETKYLKGQLLRKTIENFEAIRDQEEKLDNIYISQDDELSFITALEDIAAQNAVEQEIGLSLATSKATPAYEPLALKLEITGEFNNLLQYLRGIEKLPYYFNISKIIAKTSSDNAANNQTINLFLEGQVYKTKIINEEIE